MSRGGRNPKIASWAPPDLQGDRSDLVDPLRGSFVPVRMSIELPRRAAPRDSSTVLENKPSSLACFPWCHCVGDQRKKPPLSLVFRTYLVLSFPPSPLPSLFSPRAFRLQRSALFYERLYTRCGQIGQTARKYFTCFLSFLFSSFSTRSFFDHDSRFFCEMAEFKT